MRGVFAGIGFLKKLPWECALDVEMCLGFGQIANEVFEGGPLGQGAFNDHVATSQIHPHEWQ